jgi:hypothetical protein
MLYWVTSTEEASGGQDIGTAQPIFFPQRWNRKGSSIIGWLQKILGQGECRKGTSFNQRENYVGKGCLLFLGGCRSLTGMMDNHLLLSLSPSRCHHGPWSLLICLHSFKPVALD